MTRNSSKKCRVIALLNATKSPMTAEEIYIVVSKENDINLSTVYRILKRLEVEGIVQKTLNDDRKYYYNLIHNSHEHYIMCTKCHKVEYLDACPLNEILENVSKSGDFEIISHSVKIEGICKKCKNDIKNKQGNNTY